MAIYLGTDQWPWTKVVTVSVTTELPSEGFRNHATIANSAEINLSGKESNSFAIRCYGKNNGANVNCRASFQIIGLTQPVGGSIAETVGIYLGRFVVELGAAVSSGGVFTTGGPYKFAHKIFVTDDATNKPPGFRIAGDEDDAWAEIIFDAMGCQKIVVAMTNVDPNLDAPNPTAEIGYVWRPV